ncbi:MAG: glycosyltransferase family 39 protein [Chloroflexi bacterium]|nr:glycosyltransferase family 39 protein [Chloroflexota bacterium]
MGFGLLVLVLALIPRLSLLVRSGWLLEGDDSLSTLMALAIYDRRDLPIMLKNQTYAGAWEPYAMAAFFAVAGPSRWAAKLPELLASLGVVWATWLLTRSVAGSLAGRIAAVLAALAPPYTMVLGLKPWAAYTEVILFGTLCVHACIRLAFGPRERRGRWALWAGAAGGIAFWMHPIAAFYLVPGAAVVAGRLRSIPLLRGGALGLVGFLVAAAPVWLYNLQTGGATLQFIAAGSGGQTADRWQVFQAWWNADLPRALGLWNPWGATPRGLAIAAAAVFATAVVWAAVRRERFPRPLDAPLLVLVAVPVLVVLSGFGGPALNPWGFDATGRYAPPLWFALVPVLAAFLASLRAPNTRSTVVLPDPSLPSSRRGLLFGTLSTARSGRRVRASTGSDPAPLLREGSTGTVLPSPHGGDAGRSASGRAPRPFEAPPRSLAPLPFRPLIAFTLLSMVVASNLVGLSRTDPVQAFQSPYWPKLPVDNGPLLDALAARQVDAIWLNHWAAFPVMFDARVRGQPLIAYDWYDVQAGGIDRFPEYRLVVEGSPRAAFVLVTDEPRPELLDRLDELGVQAEVVRVPTYVVVIPTSRTVHPSEVTSALDYRY